MEHPIESVMSTTMEHLKSMVDVNTIIGTPVTATDGSVIIPVSKVSFGFVSGGGQYECSPKPNNATGEYPFGGGSGAGVSLNPVAFLVVSKEGVNMIPATFESSYDRLIEMVPSLICSVKKALKKEDKA